MSVRAIKPAWIFSCDFCHKEETREIQRTPEQWEYFEFGVPAATTHMLACRPCTTTVIRAIKGCVQAKGPRQ